MRIIYFNNIHLCYHQFNTSVLLEGLNSKCKLKLIFDLFHIQMGDSIDSYPISKPFTNLPIEIIQVYRSLDKTSDYSFFRKSNKTYIHFKVRPTSMHEKLLSACKHVLHHIFVRKYLLCFPDFSTLSEFSTTPNLFCECIF